MESASYSKLLLGIARIFWTLVLRGLYFQRVRGRDNVPSSGPVILAPNHSSYLDPPAVSVPLRRVTYYMAWHRLFEVPVLGWVIWRLGARPVNLAVSADRSSYRTVVELLRGGHVVCIFPEGQRNTGWELIPFKPGVASLALETGAKVVPVWIDGAGAAWPRHQRFPKPFVPMSVRYLPAIDPSKIGRGLSTKERRGLLTKRIERTLHRAAEKSRYRPN